VTRRASTVAKKAPPPLPTLRSVGLCTRWVLTLLFQGYKNDAVRAALGADDLPCATDAELDAMRAAYVPKKFKLKSPTNAALLKQLGIAPFVERTAEAEEAHIILRQPRVREFVEAGLIAGVPVRAIAETLKAYPKYEASPAAIAHYHNMLFDTLAMSRGQLRIAVRERVRIAVARMVKGDEDEVTVRRAIDTDARCVAVSLPCTPLAWSAVLMSLGYAGRQELTDVIGQMESLAVVRAGESLLRGEPGDERRAEAFVGVLQKIHETRATVISPESQLTKELVSFRLRHEVKPLKTIEQLLAPGDERAVDMGPPLTEAGDVDDIVDNVEARPLAANGTSA